MSNFSTSYSHAAPFIRQQAVYAAAAVASSRTIRNRKEASGRLDGVMAALEILLESPEGKGSPGEIADERSLPTSGLDYLRDYLFNFPDADKLFPTVRIPARIRSGNSQPSEIRPGTTIVAVNGRAVPAFTVASVVPRRSPLTGERVWSIVRPDGRTELSLYEQDVVTTH